MKTKTFYPTVPRPLISVRLDERILASDVKLLEASGLPVIAASDTRQYSSTFLRLDIPMEYVDCAFETPSIPTRGLRQMRKLVALKKDVPTVHGQIWETR